VMQFTLLGLAT